MLAGILAVLAGLLGMHVLAGTHGAHASAAYTQTAPASDHAASGHAASDHTGPATHHETPTPASCVCGGGCGEQHAAHTSCTPAPSGASLSAPLPGTTLLAVQPRSAAEVDQLPAYSYLPTTPTPNELSISRT
nr:DUF6153 family protein [Arthrobacter sp. C9C5]